MVEVSKEREVRKKNFDNKSDGGGYQKTCE